jgi:hypothetical protein
MLFRTIFLVVSSANAQDQPAPSQFQGVWSGTVTQKWGQVGSDPKALQCTPDTTEFSVPSTITINNFATNISAHGAVTQNYGNPNWVFPAYAGMVGTWAAYSGTTASIRINGQLQCISMVRSGNTLTTVLLGGEGFTYQNQCSSSATSLVPNALTDPYCQALPYVPQQCVHPPFTYNLIRACPPLT